MADSSRLHAVDCARRAAERTAAILHRDLGRGMAGLQQIAWTAPLLGMLGTAVALMSALRAHSLPGFAFCDCAGGLAETFVPIALSLPVAVFASGGFRCLTHQIETFELETRITTLDLLDHLARPRSAHG